MSADEMRSAAATAMPGSISRRDGEDLPRLVRRRVGDEGAAIALGAHQPFERQHLQRGARHGAADVEQRADLAFRKLGAGRQPPVDDGVAQLVADRLRAILVGAVDCGEVLIGNVHERVIHPF